MLDFCRFVLKSFFHDSSQKSRCPQLLEIYLNSYDLLGNVLKKTSSKLDHYDFGFKFK